MKPLILPLLLASLLLGSEISQAGPVSLGEAVQLLRLKANVDGSGRFVFTSEEAHYVHKQWQPPTQVKVDGEPWEQLEHSPAGWHDFSQGLDLTHAWIVERGGRDVIALEQTAGGFDLYVSDSPNGSADYEVTIAIPRKR